ncbi:MAG: antibiotic biosynthesis monooxygenase, partial [Actinobacteria bacterium]|nr:antibiotic biosynthesis monooxygenase [Actinomycetota bacterium]
PGGTAMVIVAGHFVVDPADQAAFVAGREEAMRRTRTEPGCLEYVMAADPVDPSRVVLYERWADQAALDVHLALLASGGSRATGPAPLGVEVRVYDVAGERTLG